MAVVSLIDVSVIGLPVLLFYILKTYFKARLVWEQFR
jgi:hypothetical protein